MNLLTKLGRSPNTPWFILGFCLAEGLHLIGL